MLENTTRVMTLLKMNANLVYFGTEANEKWDDTTYRLDRKTWEEFGRPTEITVLTYPVNLLVDGNPITVNATAWVNNSEKLYTWDEVQELIQFAIDESKPKEEFNLLDYGFREGTNLYRGYRQGKNLHLTECVCFPANITTEELIHQLKNCYLEPENTLIKVEAIFPELIQNLRANGFQAQALAKIPRRDQALVNYYITYEDENSKLSENYEKAFIYLARLV